MLGENLALITVIHFVLCIVLNFQQGNNNFLINSYRA